MNFIKSCKILTLSKDISLNKAKPTVRLKKHSETYISLVITFCTFYKRKLLEHAVLK